MRASVRRWSALFRLLLLLLPLLWSANCRPSTHDLAAVEGLDGRRRLQQTVVAQGPSAAPPAPMAGQDDPAMGEEGLASNATDCLLDEFGNLEANCTGTESTQGDDFSSSTTAIGSGPLAPSPNKSPRLPVASPEAGKAEVQPEASKVIEASPPPIGRTFTPGPASVPPNVGGEAAPQRPSGDGGGGGGGLRGWVVGVVVAAAVSLAVLAGVAGFYGVRKHRNRHKQFKKFVSAHLDRWESTGGDGRAGGGGWGNAGSPGGWGPGGGGMPVLQQERPGGEVELGKVGEKYSLASSCGSLASSSLGLIQAPFPCTLPNTLPSHAVAHTQQQEQQQQRGLELQLWPPRWDSAQSEVDAVVAAQQAQQGLLQSKASRLGQVPGCKQQLSAQHYGQQAGQLPQQAQQEGGFYVASGAEGDDEDMEDASASVAPMEAEDSPSVAATFHNPLSPLLLPQWPPMAGREAGGSPRAPGTPGVAALGLAEGVEEGAEAGVGTCPEPMDLESLGAVLAPNPWVGLLPQGQGQGLHWWDTAAAQGFNATAPQLELQPQQPQQAWARQQQPPLQQGHAWAPGLGQASPAPAAATPEWEQFWEAAGAAAPPPGAPPPAPQQAKRQHERAQAPWQQPLAQLLGEGHEADAADSPVEHSTLQPPFPSNGTSSSRENGDECSPTLKRGRLGSASESLAGAGTVTASDSAARQGGGAAAAAAGRRGSGNGAAGDSRGGSGSGASAQLPAVLGEPDWEISPDEIQICKRPDGSDWQLGAGAFGRVYKALRGGVTEVAVKVLAGDAGEDEGFRREVSILRSCRDVNVVQFLGACFQPGHTMLVCEYMAGGDLRTALSRQRPAFVWGGGGRGRALALDIARGLHYLHSRRIVHFDIKSNNVLLSPGGSPAKIADVGLAAVVSQRYISLDGLRGAFAWAAPEVLTGVQRCSEKADIYSLGVVLWELVTGEVPQRGKMREPRVPQECPPEIAALIDRCLEPNPARRPSAKQVYFAIQASPPTSAGGEAAGEGARPAAAAAPAHARALAA